MAHFHPLESSPGTCLPSPFAGRWKKGRSVRQIPRHSHTPLIPFVCPSPCSHSPFSPALPPTSVSHSRMAHGSPGTCRDGWMDATLGFSSRNPLARSCRFAFPSPPSPQPNAAAGKQKTGERGGKCRAAHPPPQRGLRFLWEGRRGGPALRERGERAAMGRDVLAGLDKCPGIPPPKSFPFSAAAFLQGSMESSIALCWEQAATASPASARLGSGKQQGRAAHPIPNVLQWDHPGPRHVRGTRTKNSAILRDLSLKSGTSNSSCHCTV